MRASAFVAVVFVLAAALVAVVAADFQRLQAEVNDFNKQVEGRIKTSEDEFDAVFGAGYLMFVEEDVATAPLAHHQSQSQSQHATPRLRG